MFKSISELDAHFRYTNVSVIFSVFSLCNCLSIYSKSLRVLTIFRCLIFKVLFARFSHSYQLFRLSAFRCFRVVPSGTVAII